MSQYLPHKSESQRTLLNLSTELLIQILAYHPPVYLSSVQHTSHKICHIVVGTYTFNTPCVQINGVDDLLPPDFTYSESLELL
jgi:hypothetical protein